MEVSQRLLESQHAEDSMIVVPTPNYNRDRLLTPSKHDAVRVGPAWVSNSFHKVTGLNFPTDEQLGPAGPTPTASFLSNKRKELPTLSKRDVSPKKHSKKRWWSEEEDRKLIELVKKYGVGFELRLKAKNWKKIASFFEDRTDVQCLHRWQKVLNPTLVKGPWTKEEDAIVETMVKQNGPKNWSVIAQNLPGRIGKQCRERWHNHLNPNIKKERWTEEEDLQIMAAHKM